MRPIVSLLLIAGIALPSMAEARAPKPKPVKAAKAARAAQPAVHGSSLAAAAWAVPAAGGMMAVAVGGLTGALVSGHGTSDDDRVSGGSPGIKPITGTAPSVSPE